jgi:ribosomal protein L24E
MRPVSDDRQGDDQLHRAPQSGKCDGPGCTNSGGAFTSERDGRIYEFCSEACRAAFERPSG